MNIKMNIKYSIQNLFSARMRSILAIIGIMVGTGSVVSLVYSGHMATEHALSQFKSLGTNIVSVNISQTRSSNEQGKDESGITIPLLQSLKKTIASITKYTAYTTQYVEMFHHGKRIENELVGIDDSFASVINTQLDNGRYVSELDKESPYCVLGSKLAAKLSNGHSSQLIGHQILVGKHYYTVVGTLKPWPENYIISLDINNSTLVPLQNALNTGESQGINQIVAKIDKAVPLKEAGDHITQYIQQHTSGLRVHARNPKEVIDMISKSRQTFELLLSAIASISLVVGGIGVMNIMLVSITERRKEIGLLMAIGAQKSDITALFISESILLTAAGGAFGIIIGIAIAYIIAAFNGWERAFYLAPILLGFFVSTFVGVVSGLYPALKAADMDPIDALRSN